MGACTWSENRRGVDENKVWVQGALTFSASYASGGDTFDATALTGLVVVSKVLLRETDAGYSIKMVGGDDADDLLDGVQVLIKAYAAGAQVADTTDLSAVTLPVRFYGN